MKTLRTTCFSAIVGVFLSASAFVASAAHESNNYAVLSAEGSEAAGIAVVNYIKGKSSGDQDIFNGGTMVAGLAEGTYTFAVRVNVGDNIGEPQVICTINVDDSGAATCTSDQFPLGGFHEALIIDQDGNIVLSGFFERRGGKRASAGAKRASRR